MIQVYENGDFGSLRTVEEDGVVTFCANRFSRILKHERCH